jgi:hypothetical protein
MTASTIDKETPQSAAPSASEQRKFFLAALIYSILLLSVVALAAYLLWDRLTEPKFFYVPAHIWLWALIGGMVAVLHRAAYQPKDDDAPVQFYAWVVAKPVIGTVMGGLVYLLAVCGELFLNSKTQIDNIQFLCVAAFIGGFSDRFSIDLITKIAGSAKHKRRSRHQAD